MDEWKRKRIIKMHEKGVDFSAIVEVAGEKPEDIQGVLGEHYAEDFNKKQKEVGLVRRA